jgi:GH24 family phage-related lysozyme (muramidase)
MDTNLILSSLEKFEGRIRHMYVCTGGEVTIGIGHAIQNPNEAVQLSWTLDGRAALAEEIRADFAKVVAAPKGLAASGYASLSRVRMADPTIDALAAADVTRFANGVAAVLPNWDRYPACVQAALFDMAFNLGIGGLQKFKKLIAACDQAQWETAARECHRQGIGESRNQDTAALFRQALT